MLLVDALLNATVYCGFFYIAVTAILYAVDWTEARIKLEPAKQTAASAKSHKVTKVPQTGLIKSAGTALAAA